MTLTFDKPAALERATSDWTRDDDGRPQILADPEWTPETAPDTWIKRGELLPMREYTRVTTFVEAPLDGTMLARWKMRRVALGMGRRPDYVTAAAALTAEDYDRKALNDLAEKALEAAGPNAADIGTALHAFTERIDRGEPLGFVPEQYRADLDAYRREIAHVTFAHRETRMVCDQLEVAGTPDGIGYLDMPDPDGVTGQLHIIDLKTGDVERTAGKFSAQLAVYAHSALYAPATGARTWPENLSRRWGLVLHMPAGAGSAEFRWINLEHGWLGARLAEPIRAWRRVNHADLMRPLVPPEPRTVPDGMCAGRKRDGEPCGFKAKAEGFCTRHADQVGVDLDAPVPRRVTEVAAVVSAVLDGEQPATVNVAQLVENVRELGRAKRLSEESTAVDEPVDKPCERCGATGADGCICEPWESEDAADLDGTDEDIAPVSPLVQAVEQTVERILEQPRELNGNPTPHTSMPTPEDAADAAQRAELALMDQIRECRTTGELAMLYERTGFAWTHHVKAYATRHREGLPAAAQADRRGAALLAAIGAAISQAELSLLFTDPRNRDLITQAHKDAARARAQILPPF